jgi:5-(aminomethyl)-3-furanmethanol phosphate kinase
MPDVVVKIGGGLLRTPTALDEVLAGVVRLARTRRVLIVPGGGMFADAVRDADRRVGLPSTTAHWMAVLAMDQHAHLLAARLPQGRVVAALDEAAREIDEGRLPVLAPYRWLSAADPLPHCWDITSDSIAAWVAGEARARHLLLIKPPGASGDLVDAYFDRVVPPALTPIVVPAEVAATAFAQIARRVSRTAETT